LLQARKNGGMTFRFSDFFLFQNNMTKQLGQAVNLPLTKEKMRSIVPLLKYAGLDIDLDKMKNPFQVSTAT
jgi:hypothetical protein